MSHPPAGSQDYATVLDFVTASSDPRRDGGGSEVDSVLRASEPALAQQDNSVGTAGHNNLPDDLAALPTVPRGNTVNETADSAEGNREGINLYESGKYNKLVVDVPVDSPLVQRLSMRGSTRAKYRLFCVPSDSSGLDDFCFIKKGRGQEVFCIKKDCKTSHQGDRAHMQINPGTLYVQKDKDTAFCSPYLEQSRIDEGLISTWLNTLHTLQEWADLFADVAAKQETHADPDPLRGIKVSVEEFERKAEAATRDLDLEYPTPPKHFEEGKNNMYVPALPKFEPIESCSEFGDPQTHHTVKALLRDLDEKIFVLKNSLNDLLAWKSEETHSITNLRTNFDKRSAELADLIGSKPSNLPTMSTIWEGVGFLANKLVTAESDWVQNWSKFKENLDLKSLFATEFQTEILRFQREITTVKDMANAAISTREKRLEEENQKLTEELRTEKAARNAQSREMFLITDRLEKLESFSTTAARSLKNQITELVNQVNSSARHASSKDDSSVETEVNPNTLTEVWSTLEKLSTGLDKATREIISFKTSQDKEVVKFGGLGFQSNEDCSSWVEMHAAVEGYGWVYDFHTLMQAVHTITSGEDLIKRLAKGYKLQIEDGHQAATVASFEGAMPKVFCSNPAHTVVLKEQSFFTNIKTWNEWDLPHLGHRDLLLEKLEEVRSAHLDHINDHLVPGTQLYSLAVEALQTSYSWSTGLIKFCDDIYRTYVKAKFGSTIAFHVATRLTKVLIVEVFKPRQRVAMALKACNQIQIAQVSLLAIVRSLDVMRKVQDLNYTNHPAVANELVKFLAVNTEFQSIKDLQSDVTKYKEDVATLKREIAGVVKSNQTANNKFDQLKSEVSTLAKRVKALEK